MLVFLLAILLSAENISQAGVPDPDFSWKPIETGYSFGRYELGEPDSVIRPEVFLLKFDLKRFQINLVRASSILGSNADIRTLSKKVNGLAGINANFFDEQGRPLGLLIENSVVQQKLQRGGNLLGGVFAVRKGIPVIERRDSFDPTNVAVALQAGPRLIEKSRAVAIQSADETSRRSGVAITKKGEIILYATVLRFPGATFTDIQAMLLDPALEISDALNLDGGGSSQLFMEGYAGHHDETFITGGDAVPVGLVISRKQD